jgi:hypothetical protein
MSDMLSLLDHLKAMPRNLTELAKSKIFPLGYWGWAHDFQTCPTGDRHCCHYRWERVKKS